MLPDVLGEEAVFYKLGQLEHDWAQNLLWIAWKAWVDNSAEKQIFYHSWFLLGFNISFPLKNDDYLDKSFCKTSETL